MNPHVTFRDLLGSRIYGIETPGGFVYVVANEIFMHESEAVRSIKSDAPNPVIEAMEAEEISVADPVEIKE